MKTLFAVALLLGGLQAHANDWQGWDSLPDDLLGLSGEGEVHALVHRLDSLIDNQLLIEDIDQLLDYWLDVYAHAEPGRTISLQQLLERNPQAFSGHPAVDALQNRPIPANNPNRPAPGNNSNRPDRPTPPAGPPGDKGK
ncbi:hypothetical protein NFC81_03245 [Salinispirillum sp. LH 10-3-1]|uniref:Uncharacterized protein n=1 Tax=Salinispirillum sp. LH 10-3-1 TaxID=2952525 RepID=A0AB38YHL6_9GAMM